VVLGDAKEEEAEYRKHENKNRNCKKPACETLPPHELGMLFSFFAALI